jgi:pimeloyl-ACP methyl ester carboxylesterase
MSTQNSTNVRSNNALLRQSYRTLGAVAPNAAAELAARLFVRAPSRRKDSNRQSDVLKAGERFDVTFGERRLAGWKWGEGPRVLLVHGWGGSAGQLAEFVLALTSAGFSVVAFDAPGHGASPGTELSLPLFASAIERVASLVGPLHGVVTHSLGGPATALAMKRGLKIARAVFVAPPADAFDWFKKFGQELGLHPSSELAARRRIEHRVGVPFEQLNHHALGPHIGVPLLVIHDRGDKQVLWSDGQAVAKTAPNATFLTTEGLGHQRILKSESVVGDAVAFLKGELRAEQALERLEHVESEPFAACAHRPWALASSSRSQAGPCPQCELERELFDREARYGTAA